MEAAKQVSRHGTEYWWGREIMAFLHYSSWARFEGVVKRAVKACESSGQPPLQHFHRTERTIRTSNGAQRKRSDWALSRYACYLIAMNGSSAKPEIAHAQTYFALQTRRHELNLDIEQARQRIDLRERMSEANKDLASAASRHGVEAFPAFQAAGYEGLYGGLTMADIRELKGLEAAEPLLDRMGRTELAANYFRATQAADKLRREDIQGDAAAQQTHFEVGKKVRETIEQLGGTPPEQLPAEPPIREIRSKLKELKNIESASSGARD